ncbi:uncharacterized protein AKAME5_002312700 [Lates japonicus]|uniref:Integrase p58-like C-terminal domain-containing protein n=1 Tax=Lates japonicus TaxID=270547 RepID=A0AAD3NF02_LATJO|nr:uncharacterized protein AKAME5_002312700 [Lates japonicus]
MHQIHYQVGDTVWHLVKGTKRVKNRVRKFLPSYEGPYMVVGLLDDMVYRIQKSERAKVKVVHHDKLKPFYSRTPLDNSWAFQSAEEWSAVEVPPPAADVSTDDTDIGPLNLWDTQPEMEVTAAGDLQSSHPSQTVCPDCSHPPESSAWPQLDGGQG